MKRIAVLQCLLIKMMMICSFAHSFVTRVLCIYLVRFI